MSYAQYIPFIAIELIILGVVLLIGYSFTQNKANTSFGFGGFIGPIPFGFAKDMPALQIIMIVLFILAIIMFLVRL